MTFLKPNAWVETLTRPGRRLASPKTWLMEPRAAAPPGCPETAALSKLCMSAPTAWRLNTCSASPRRSSILVCKTTNHSSWQSSSGAQRASTVFLWALKTKEGTKSSLWLFVLSNVEHVFINWLDIRMHRKEKSWPKPNKTGPNTKHVFSTFYSPPCRPIWPSFYTIA